MLCFFGIAFLLGTASIMIYINHNYSTCIVGHLMYSNCYEKGGELYMEQYFRLDNNRTGYISCGSVANCETSLCKKYVIIGKLYECKLQGNNYEIDHSPTGMYILVVCMALIAFASFITPMSLFGRCIYPSYLRDECENDTSESIYN